MSETKKSELYQTVFQNYPDVVTVEQVCEMLGGTTRQSVYRLIRKGALKSIQIGKRYLVPKLRVMEYLHIIEATD